MSDAELLDDEARYCSFGDTVHYAEPPKVFARCEGSYLYDSAGVPYLDLQMWYSAVNFGYANRRLNDVVKRQLDTLPQVASQYLHASKIELAKTIAQDAERKWGMAGRVHFNVGGSQSIEDSLKIVRNASGGKSLMFAFEGGYHGRTLGASAITSSYRYRRRYGHFGTAPASSVPLSLSRASAHEQGGLRGRMRPAVRAAVRDGVPRCVGPEGRAMRVRRVLCRGRAGNRRLRHSAAEFLRRAQEGPRPSRRAAGGGRDPDGFLPNRKAVGNRALRRDADVLVFGKALTNGLNPLAGLWAREALINPVIFPPGSTHSTFASNPLGTAIGLETMKMLAESDYEAMVTRKGRHFLEGLRDLQKHHREIGDVDGLGLALRAEICGDDGYTPNKALVDRMVAIGLAGDLVHRGRPIGLVLDVGGYYKNVITFAPSLHIEEADIDLFARVAGPAAAQGQRRRHSLKEIRALRRTFAVRPNCLR
jgi:4-aminobutyrate aminotransferase-like enzyme